MKTTSLVFLIAIAAHGAEISPSTFAGLTRTSVNVHPHHGTTHESTYDGVALGDVVRKNGAPAGEAIRGPKLMMVVVVKASDGYQAVFSLAELDPAFTKKTVLLVDRKDGQPLPKDEGPYRLIVPDEERQARWVRQVVSVELRQLN